MVAEKAQGAEMEAQFVQQMRLLREAQGISQGELASRMVNAGWDYWRQTTVSRVEKFERTLRLAEAHDIARILGHSVAGMLTWDKEVRDRNVEAAERQRDLDDWVGRLNRVTASFMAQLEQFHHTLNQADTSREEPATRLVEELWASAAAQGRDSAADVAAEAARAARAVEESIRSGTGNSDGLRKLEARHGIDPET